MDKILWNAAGFFFKEKSIILPFSCVGPQTGRIGNRTNSIDDVIDEQLPGMLSEAKESRIIVEPSIRLRLRYLASLGIQITYKKNKTHIIRIYY